MANEFEYSVSLSIVHPSIDPKNITAELTELHPVIQAFAGTERRDRQGRLVKPARKTMYSHWLAELHAEERLFSGDVPVSEFIVTRLCALERHRDMFLELDKEGEVTLVIALYCKGNYSAEVLYAHALKQCGDLGINIELDIYFDHCDNDES
jgi:hypothetical protein